MNLGKEDVSKQDKKKLMANLNILNSAPQKHLKESKKKLQIELIFRGSVRLKLRWSVPEGLVKHSAKPSGCGGSFVGRLLSTA